MINPITGEEEDDLTQGQPIPSQSVVPAQSPMTLDDILGQYNTKHNQLVQDQSGYDTTGAITGALASLGAAFQGKDSLAAVNQIQNQRRQAKNDQMSQLDKWKQAQVDDIKARNESKQAERTQTMQADNDDPTSEISQRKQALAQKLSGGGQDFSQVSGSKIDQLLPTVTKLYETDQKRLERQDALAQQKLLKEMALGGKGTEGQKQVDKDYAKDYNEWTSSGRPVLEKNLSSLQEARDALKADSSLTGGLTGTLPERLTADRVLKQRQKVQSAVQNSLKATLGAQFTEKEGERILKNAYNEAASPETNLESLDKLIAQLQTQGQANDAKAKFFENKGSLTGYSGTPAVASQMTPSGSGKQVVKTQTNQKTGQKRVVYSDGTSEIVDSVAGR